MNNTVGIEYGNGFMRFVAIMLDTFILLPISAIIASLSAEASFVGLAVNLAIHMVYYVGFLSGPWRATPGKRVMGLYVVGTEGVGALSKEHAAMRFIAYHIPTLPFYSSMFDMMQAQGVVMLLMMAWFLPIFFHDEKAGVHDMLCKTRVMKGRI